MTGCLHCDAQMLTSSVWGFKRVLWWCVACCIYVWALSVPIWPWTLTVRLRLGVTPPPRQAPVCWHLKNQIALSSETRALHEEERAAVLVRRVKEREWEKKYVVVKKKGKKKKRRENNEGNTPHPADEGDEFQSCSLPPFLPPFLCAGWSSWECSPSGFGSNTTVRENLFPIWVFPVNAGNGNPHKAKLVSIVTVELPHSSLSLSTVEPAVPL